MRANAFLSWFVPLFALYVAFHVARFYRRAGCEADAREIMAERRKRAEAAKAAKQSEREAAKAAKRAEAASQPRRKPGRPRKESAGDAAPTPALAPPVPVFERRESVSPANQTIKGNNAFAVQTVAFTGTLPGMTRREAINAVEANGGRAFETMPVSTTLLVVGDNPGMNKLDLADKRIGQVRKITLAQFRAMLGQPLTLTPDEFAAIVER